LFLFEVRKKCVFSFSVADLNTISGWQLFSYYGRLLHFSSVHHCCLLWVLAIWVAQPIKDMMLWQAMVLLLLMMADVPELGWMLFVKVVMQLMLLSPHLFAWESWD
jgi:hypothetical protein